MRRFRHALRDVVVLTLPLTGLAVYLWAAALTSFYNAEVVNYSGYPVRALRVGSLRSMLERVLEPVLEPARGRRYLPDLDPAGQGAPFLDLRVRGSDQDRLDSALPGSGMEWVDAQVVDWTDPEAPWFRDVEARYRGQRMVSFFFDQKAWKIKTDRLELWHGQRTINVTPFLGRLDNHLAFLAGRAVGIPTPDSSLVQVYVNKISQGIYLQEEQVDEGLMRREGRMPGDVFYGEVFVPDEPKLSTDDIWMNPFVWEKQASSGRYPDEYRPHLTRLLDWVNDPSPESFRDLPAVLDQAAFARFFALLTFQGDQHLNHSHNHKLYFSPLNGRFEPVPWNVRINLFLPHAAETTANRLYRKLARDPRFLDQVYRSLATDFAGVRELQFEEIDRIAREWTRHALEPDGFQDYLDGVRGNLEGRERVLRELDQVAELRWTTEPARGGRRLCLHARSLASLRLEGLELADVPADLALYEDRDFDGAVGPADRRLATAPGEGNLLRVLDEDARVFPGRDFSASYRPLPGQGELALTGHTAYSRLAYLESDYLLVAPAGAPPVEVRAVTARRTVGPGPVTVRPGAPPPEPALETVHPWRVPAPPPGRTHRFGGVVELTRTLIVEPQDTLEVAPGTRFLLGAEVSILSYAPVHWEGVEVRRLDPARPWGVVALQGAGASGSTLVDCDLQGGSNASIRQVDYFGMLSVHEAAQVQVRGGEYSGNVLGDDTIRFARCTDLLIDQVVVRRANGDAIDCDISTGEIRDTELDHPHNDGIDLMTSTLRLVRVRAVGAGDKGVSLGERANAILADCEIASCVIGVAIKDDSDPLIQDSHIRDCDVGVSGYDKNWRYPGGGRGRLLRCELGGNTVDVRLDARSRLTLEECRTEGRYQVPVAGSLTTVPGPGGGAP